MEDEAIYKAFYDIEEADFEGGKTVATCINCRPVYLFMDSKGVHGVWQRWYPETKEERKDFGGVGFRRMMDEAFAWAFNLGSADDKALEDFHKWHIDAWDEPAGPDTSFTLGRKVTLNLLSAYARNSIPQQRYWAHILAAIFDAEGHFASAEYARCAAGMGGPVLSPQ